MKVINLLMISILMSCASTTLKREIAQEKKQVRIPMDFSNYLAEYNDLKSLMDERYYVSRHAASILYGAWRISDISQKEIMKMFYLIKEKITSQHYDQFEGKNAANLTYAVVKSNKKMKEIVEIFNLIKNKVKALGHSSQHNDGSLGILTITTIESGKKIDEVVQIYAAVKRKYSPFFYGRKLLKRNNNVAEITRVLALGPNENFSESKTVKDLINKIEKSQINNSFDAPTILASTMLLYNYSDEEVLKYLKEVRTMVKNGLLGGMADGNLHAYFLRSCLIR